MALQMPVYRELTTIESKVFMGMSWRQCLAAVILAIVCGGGYLGLWFGLGMDPSSISPTSSTTSDLSSRRSSACKDSRSKRWST